MPSRLWNAQFVARNYYMSRNDACVTQKADFPIAFEQDPLSRTINPGDRQFMGSSRRPKHQLCKSNTQIDVANDQVTVLWYTIAPIFNTSSLPCPIFWQHREDRAIIAPNTAQITSILIDNRLPESGNHSSRNVIDQRWPTSLLHSSSKRSIAAIQLEIGEQWGGFGWWNYIRR